MCGIFGLTGKEAASSHWSDVARLQNHRGPDAFGEWRDAAKQVYLAHNRLSIIDVSTNSNQPFVTAEGVLVFNGEIYNYLELRRELEKLGRVFRTTGDTEVLAIALGVWGLGALPRLRGMFAFAYYAARDGSLLLVRDRFGIKPLFFSKRGGDVFFASEVATLRHAGFGLTTDPEAQAIYHLFNFLPAPLSFYSDIVKLPPGHLLRMRDGACEMQAWYTLAPKVHGDISTLLHRSVAEHMRCDVDYGVFLSSGLDSNILAAIAAMHSAHKIRTFSIGFSEFPAFDESKWSARSAAYIGTEHHEHDVGLEEFTAAARSCLRKIACGEPFADASLVPTWLVSKAARSISKVALAGDGADEIFGGYRKYHGIRFARWFGFLPRPARVALQRIARKLPESRESRLLELLRRFRKFVDGASHEESLRQMVWLYVFFPEELAAFRGLHVDRAIERLKVLVADTRRAADDLDELGRALYVDTALFLPADMLHKVDLASMDHSLEVRVPFLDHELVETAFALPSEAKVSRGQGKLVLRREFGGLLPPFLLRLPKRGFESPLSALFRGPWNKEMAEASKWLRDVGVPRTAVGRLLVEHEQGKHDHSIRLWNLLVLATWVREGNIKSTKGESSAFA